MGGGGGGAEELWTGRGEIRWGRLKRGLKLVWLDSWGGGKASELDAD